LKIANTRKPTVYSRIRFRYSKCRKEKNADAVQGTWTPKVRKPIRNIADLKIKSEA